MPRITHGDTYTDLYKRWSSMRNRVSPKWRGRKDYFDRGITICKEWDNYLSFKDWSLNNGYTKELELDRIDNNKGYSPNNCRWTTRKINHHNKRNTVYVKTSQHNEPLTMVCEKLGLSYNHRQQIRHRISTRGWDIDKALNTPILSQYAKKKRYDYRVLDTKTGDIYDNPKQVFIKFNIPETTLRMKLNGQSKNNTQFKYLIEETT